MRNALILAALGGAALITPVVTWAMETPNEAPVYDQKIFYSSVVTNVSMPWAGPWDGTLAGPDVAVAQIPEPGSIILVLTGLGLLAYSTRRRKRS